LVEIVKNREFVLMMSAVRRNSFLHWVWKQRQQSEGSWFWRVC